MENRIVALEHRKRLRYFGASLCLMKAVTTFP
jgi:hypothetical protein